MIQTLIDPESPLALDALPELWLSSPPPQATTAAASTAPASATLNFLIRLLLSTTLGGMIEASPVHGGRRNDAPSPAALGAAGVPRRR
jgi:hypothetical protein